MKKVVRLTEADLTRIIKRVIQEQGITGRNNPRWTKLFNVLRNIGSPKVLTFKDFDGNPSQSLNWGTTKTSNANSPQLYNIQPNPIRLKRIAPTKAQRIDKIKSKIIKITGKSLVKNANTAALNSQF